MSYIYESTHIDVTPAAAWDALRDWGALHTRLAAGFVTDSVIDREDGVITSFDGSVVRERLVSCDEDTDGPIRFRRTEPDRAARTLICAGFTARRLPRSSRGWHSRDRR